MRVVHGTELVHQFNICSATVSFHSDLRQIIETDFHLQWRATNFNISSNNKLIFHLKFRSAFGAANRSKAAIKMRAEAIGPQHI